MVSRKSDEQANKSPRPSFSGPKCPNHNHSEGSKRRSWRHLRAGSEGIKWPSRTPCPEAEASLQFYGLWDSSMTKLCKIVNCPEAASRLKHLTIGFDGGYERYIHDGPIFPAEYKHNHSLLQELPLDKLPNLEYIRISCSKIPESQVRFHFPLDPSDRVHEAVAAIAVPLIFLHPRCVRSVLVNYTHQETSVELKLRTAANDPDLPANARRRLPADTGGSIHLDELSLNHSALLNRELPEPTARPDAWLTPLLLAAAPHLLTLNLTLSKWVAHEADDLLSRFALDDRVRPRRLATLRLRDAICFPPALLALLAGGARRTLRTLALDNVLCFGTGGVAAAGGWRALLRRLADALPALQEVWLRAPTWGLEAHPRQGWPARLVVFDGVPTQRVVRPGGGGGVGDGRGSGCGSNDDMDGVEDEGDGVIKVLHKSTKRIQGGPKAEALGYRGNEAQEALRIMAASARRILPPRVDGETVVVAQLLDPSIRDGEWRLID